jgi:hypothetical protein
MIFVKIPLPTLRYAIWLEDFKTGSKRFERECCFCVVQKSSLMFKQLDASTLPEDILSNSEPLTLMGHSAGSAL